MYAHSGLYNYCWVCILSYVMQLMIGLMMLMLPMIMMLITTKTIRIVDVMLTCNTIRTFSFRQNGRRPYFIVDIG